MIRPLFIILMMLSLICGGFCSAWTVIELAKYLIGYSASVSSAVPLNIHFNWTSLCCAIGCDLTAVACVVASIMPSKKY